MLTKIYSEFLNGRQNFGILLTDGKYMMSVTKEKLSESELDSNDTGQSFVMVIYDQGHKMQIIS